MRRMLILLGAGLVLGGPFVVGYRLSAGSRATTPVAIPSVVDEVRSALAARYYRPVPDRVLQLGSVHQIITALRDPYTAYLAPPDYRLVRQETASTYTRIGMSVLPARHGYVVVSLRPGPAQRAGVRVGDTVVRIGGVAAARLSMSHALARILGPRGTTVQLTLLRGGKTLDFGIRRERIQAPVVQARLLSYAGERWGDVQLSGFRIGAAVVLGHELRTLARQGALGFVLDLRQNPGGLLDQAVAVSSLFLDRGVVVSLVGRHAPRKPVSDLTVRLPQRTREPETVIAHLGPTNSGKTHDALRFLVESGRGVYAAPLRMLAQEAHRRLASELGDDAVGLVTGEERVNPAAPIICCTAEMAPLRGETLVLDEVQWAEDEERGSAWTRLMLGGAYRHILLRGAVEALPLVEQAFPQVEVRFFERKTPLEWIGRRGIAGLGPGTVVVAFSRRAVIGLAGDLNQHHPGKVAVLYGAMPLASRGEEIDRFLSGAAEVCASTDVLGHGVNLPCPTLVFAETERFDGHERRELA